MIAGNKIYGVLFFQTDNQVVYGFDGSDFIVNNIAGKNDDIRIAVFDRADKLRLFGAKIFAVQVGYLQDFKIIKFCRNFGIVIIVMSQRLRKNKNPISFDIVQFAEQKEKA